jgi:hypothetical protein
MGEDRPLEMLSYGMSVALYIRSAQGLGTTRAQMIFAASPFFGVLLSVLWLHETLTLLQPDLHHRHSYLCFPDDFDPDTRFMKNPPSDPPVLFIFAGLLGSAARPRLREPWRNTSAPLMYASTPSSIRSREYHAWDEDHIVIDTANRSPEACSEELLSRLEARPII